MRSVPDSRGKTIVEITGRATPYGAARMIVASGLWRSDLASAFVARVKSSMFGADELLRKIAQICCGHISIFGFADRRAVTRIVRDDARFSPRRISLSLATIAHLADVVLLSDVETALAVLEARRPQG